MPGCPEGDLLSGTGRGDALRGEQGDDEVRGRDIGGELYGGDGNDTLYGEAGDDFLEGNRDDDVIYGGDGDDELGGGTGEDVLHGGDGNDFLDGRDHRLLDNQPDGLYCGKGRDQYVAGSLDYVDSSCEEAAPFPLVDTGGPPLILLACAALLLGSGLMLSSYTIRRVS